MAKPTITRATYKNCPCNVIGCKGTVKFQIGAEKPFSPQSCYLVCEDCLKSIMGSVMDSDNEDIIKIFDELLGDDRSDEEVAIESVKNNLDYLVSILTVEQKKELIEKLLYGDEPESDETISNTGKGIENMSYRELVTFAKEIGVNTYGMKKEELVETIKGLEVKPDAE